MSSQDPEEYLAILKASYDYTPDKGSDDEVAIKEDQILFLLERTDDDWWKVKIRGASQDEETPSGLVPAAYVEQAEHNSVVKALYDYAATSAGELTIKEDDILLVFDTEEEWLLVQSAAEGGKAGFVPANYVETHSEDEETSAPAASQIVIPDSPPRPVSTYVDPADRVANAKANADDIKTWSVSEVDKKGKKLKGTLGIGNGAVFFASETSKAAVQKWQTADITTISIEKSKHVHFDVGGPNPIGLHFHAGSKDNAEAIVKKLESSKALSSSAVPEPAAEPEPEPAASTSRAPAETSKVPKKASVHFSPASPTIIPPREDGGYSSAEDQDQEVEDVEQAVALYDFTADGDDELSVKEGEQLVVLEKDEDWWKCRNQKGQEGVVPASYVQVGDSEEDSSATTRAVEEAAAQAQVAAEAETKAKAKAEAQARAKAKAEAEAAARAKAEAEAEAKAEADRIRHEEEARARKKREAQERAEAAAAEQRRKVADEANRPASPSKRTSTSSGGKPEHGFPPADRVRTWHDRSGQFRVDAALLGFKDGKLRLHKINGVIVEVPSDKMSPEDMKFIEKYYNKKKSSKPVDDDDNIPLAQQKRAAAIAQAKAAKKAPTIDWFDFFLQAGCDLDDCTRYASAFERDKIEESQLGELTDSIMRSLGLREGDILRVKKAAEKFKPAPQKDPREDQIRRDEALARQLEAQETGGSSSSKPPNLFAEGPGGALKNSTRRGRPTPSKSLPSNVNLNAISAASSEIQRTSSPQLLSPDRASSTASPVQAPPRSSSALATTSGFDDDAWTNRPSSTNPTATAPATANATNRAPSAPPTTTAAAPAPEPTPPSAPVTAPAPAPVLSPPKTLANTTESDIFDQLARLSELRKNTPVQSPPLQASPPVNATPPPASFASGLGMGSSTVPMGQVQTQQTSTTPQPYNGPRGPFAPVPANQQLLQPLVPTQTGFGGFVPTRASSTPAFMAPQQTGLPPMMGQPTGMPGSQPLMNQPTGMPFGGFNNGSPFGQSNNGSPFNQSNNGSPFGSNNPSPFGQSNNASPFGSGSYSGPIMSNPTGFNPGFNASPFNNGMSSPPPVPPLPNSVSNNNTTDTNPANIFAQMKSGTFASDNSSAPQSSDKYDALRPNPMVAQPTGWGNFQGQSFVGYR
ncbi:cytoskeletal protein binding protein [Marasmius tenuissimus]|nr:cytoskeletal protein binding protein [Marasmius tenuissimus]